MEEICRCSGELCTPGLTEFKNFMNAGGYRKKEFWEQKFVKDGKILEWEEAMDEFKDKTGLPGPADWQAGDYASGTNHTLPTNGYAKNYSGVSLDSFVKKITFQKLSKEGIKETAFVPMLTREFSFGFNLHTPIPDNNDQHPAAH